MELMFCYQTINTSITICDLLVVHTSNKSWLSEIRFLVIMEFTEKYSYFSLSAFLIQVLLITCAYCDLGYSTVEVHNLLNTLENDKNLKSFQFYPVKIYLKADDNNEVSLGPNTVLENNVNVALRSASDMNFAKDKIETSKTGKLLRYQHRKKMEELIEFMRERYSSTNYFYSEMKRILRQYTIKDKMREMIDYCESPQNNKVKERILQFFERIKKKHDKQKNLWNEPTNDLVINVLKDPFNDGVVQ